MRTAVAAALAAIAATLTGVAGDGDVTATLKARMVSTLDDFPCVRVVSADSGGDVGCSSTCGASKPQRGGYPRPTHAHQPTLLFAVQHPCLA